MHYRKKLEEGALFTDRYQLTMAQLYFRYGFHEKEVQFEHFFREYPNYGSHQAGYCINAGINWFLDWLSQVKFTTADISALKEQKSARGKKLFADDFLRWLKGKSPYDFLTINAISEGRVIHSFEPVNVVQGPLAMCQLVESSLLNKINYQILVATKASRIKEAGRGNVVLEFGLRRAQDFGANAGSRAALIGGADFTSNEGLSHKMGFSAKGTHAHSMVQLFMAEGKGELGAFRAYADIYPEDCLLLVDTINTLESGVPNAIKVFTDLKRKGHTPIGIRLDSGDLAYLCIQSAKMLNEAGFENTSIVLSNQLDELVIWQIITQIGTEASRYGLDADRLIKRLVYGVGTNLVTSKGHSSLDGVYKLTAVRKKSGWVPSIKISETKEKIINPGLKKVWRIYDMKNKAVDDLITLGEEDPRVAKKIILHHPVIASQRREMEKTDISLIEPLLENVLDKGKRKTPGFSIEKARQLREKDLGCLYPGVKRLINPHVYHVSLSEKLWDMKKRLINLKEE
ncbi:MAG: nicotinate phosphoribosyltransferase [Candidatus Omnitrophica bacterium]|nr:nicotinate phosphoribosyltransferase [Candidatus Omnitrophota bacterium]